MIYVCPHCKKENKVAGRSIGEAPAYKPIPSTCWHCGKQYQPDDAAVVTASPAEPVVVPPAITEEAPASDERNRWRRFKRMAMKMATMIAWPAEETFTRACGDVLCDQCGLPYFDHPEKDGLSLDCNGRLWKL